MTRRQCCQYVCLLSMALWVVLLVPSAGLAKVTTWTDGFPSNNNWSNPNNWDNGVPANQDTVVLPAAPWFSAMNIPGLTLGALLGAEYQGEMALYESLTVLNDVELGGLVGLNGFALHVQGSLELNGTLWCNNSELRVDGALLSRPGSSLEMGSGLLELNGDGELTDLTLAFSSGSLVLAGSAAQTLTFGPDLVQLGNLQIAKITPSDLVAITAPEQLTIAGALIVGGSLDVDGSLLIGGNLVVPAGGSLTLTSNADYDLYVTGSTTINGELALGGGSLTTDGLSIADGGRVHGSGAPCRLDLQGDVTIRNGELELESGSAVTTAAGVEIRVDDAGQLVNLPYGPGESGPRTTFYQDGVTGGDTWSLTVLTDGQADLTDADIMDCDASAGLAVTAAGFALDSGNNANITFPGPTHSLWTNGSTAGADWSDLQNWKFADFDPNRPIRMDLLEGSSIMDIAGLYLPELDMTGFTGTLILTEALSIDGALQQYGTLQQNGRNLAVCNLDLHGELHTEGGNLAILGTSHITAEGALLGGKHKSWFWVLGDLQVDGLLEIPSGGSSGLKTTAAITVSSTGSLYTVTEEEVAGQVSLINDGFAGGRQWHLNAQPGSQISLSNVFVQDSDASSGELIIAGPGSTSGGNNSNWDFASPAPLDTPLRLTARAAPNPANPATTLRFTVPSEGRVTVLIHDLQGRRVRTLIDQQRTAGDHEAVWRGRDDAGNALASGVYVYSVEAGGQVASGKVTLVN